MAENESLIFLPSVGSTNTELKKLAFKGAAHGTVLYAASQTAGRGRLGRSFASPEGGLYLSVLLRPDFAPVETLGIMPSAAAALCLALDGLGIHADIKWPNDLQLGGKKLAGILTEGITDTEGRFAMILGIGLNMNTQSFPAEICDIAVSLSQYSGESYDIHAAAQSLTSALDEMYRAYSVDRSAFLRIYKERCITVGKTVTLPDGSSADVLGINDDFSLSVRQGETVKRLSCGEVQ